MKDFPELNLLDKCLQRFGHLARVRIEQTISYENCDLPIYSIALGAKDPQKPCLALIGGVHGLERVGSHVVIAYLWHLCERLQWDESLRYHLESIRMIFYPIANPAGMLRQTRSNAEGVDLMRNAPISREQGSIYNILAGHRFSPKLPWFRGYPGEPMQAEAQALVDFCRRELCPSKLSIALDVHSGFGFRDHLWFPYAKTQEPVASIAEYYALRRLLRKTYDNHVYKFEPQSLSYTTHGDLWDFIYDEAYELNNRHNLLPLTLEMGSWNWVRKNPRQLLSIQGLFNPIVQHRLERTLRRHMLLFDFLQRAIRSSTTWFSLSDDTKKEFTKEAKIKWFANC